MLKLNYPFDKKFSVGQPFSKNYNTYYAEDKLLGHTGYDMNTFWGDTIFASCDAYCYLIGNEGNKDPMKYRAVYTVVDDIEGGVSYEVSYGHLNEVFVKAGSFVKFGDKLGTEGNTGDVASGGKKVTKDMKLQGSTAGTHLHFQVRLLKKVDKKEKGKTYLYFGSKINGSIYEIPYYNNGFKGCVDPEPFFTGVYAGSFIETIQNYFSPKLTQNMRYGSNGEQVKLLQKKLNLPTDGIYGKGTEKAVKEYQKANKLLVDGIVGNITRNLLNK